ncbi:4857_t:CDS:2, partial [Paraglomus brasilianum]
MSRSQTQTIQEKITEYESFINDKLKIYLKTALDLRDEFEIEASDSADSREQSPQDEDD